MTVWIVTQAWEGEILGVFDDADAARQLLQQIQADPQHRPVSIEEWDVTRTPVERKE